MATPKKSHKAKTYTPFQRAVKDAKRIVREARETKREVKKAVGKVQKKIDKVSKAGRALKKVKEDTKSGFWKKTVKVGQILFGKSGLLGSGG